MTSGARQELLLTEARERFDAAEDFTVSVEEEFALLDPATLDLVNRFEEVQAAAKGTVLEPNLVGELIASEVEVKTGKQESFADVPAALAERRAELAALVEPMGLTLGATGTHPWASWRDQRIIDTPHYRRNDEILRYVVWRNNTFGIHTHVAIRGADRAVRVVDALRNWLPELLAVSASSPFHEGVDTGLHSARTQVFTRFFPRCGVPDTLRLVGRVRRLRALPLRDRLGGRADPALVERAPAPPVPDGRDPDLRRAARHRGGAGVDRAHGRAHGAVRARARRGRAAPRPPAPADRGEHLAGDPVRPLRRADRPRAGRRRSRRGPGSSGSSSGFSPSPTRSAPRRGSGFPSGTPPSARSPGARKGRASRRSTRSRSAPPRSRAAESGSFRGPRTRDAVRVCAA